MARYRKLPLEVDAVQWWPGVTVEGVIEGPYRSGDEQEYLARCPTLEGIFGVSPGDWIITGVKGERWPVKPDIFALTYAPATGADPLPDALTGILQAAVQAQRGRCLTCNESPALYCGLDCARKGR